VDRPYARPEAALDETFDLFIELGADDDQADFPVLYGSGLAGWLVRDLAKDPHQGMEALFESIVEHVPPPEADQEGPFLMQVNTLAWSDYVGQIGCGRVLRGRLREGDELTRRAVRWRESGRPDAGWEVTRSSAERTVRLWVTRGLQRTEVREASAGDIVWIAGPEEIGIGDTLSALDSPEPALKPLEIDESTVSMFFQINSGPLAGDDGTAVTLRQLKERLERELRTNVALRMDDIGRDDGVKLLGRGELHLAILIEEMRREGMELCVSRPEVITRLDANGRTLEPIEQLIIDVPGQYQGVVIEKIAGRKGEMINMDNLGTGVIRMEFEIPTRGLIGYRTEFLTDTRGLGIMTSRFVGYGLWRGDVTCRTRGSVISMATGLATAYQLENLQQRVSLFVEPLEQIYEGQIVGENSRRNDMPCNPTKRKALTNHRASTKEATVTLAVPRKMTLDQALEWIAADELVEVTPKSVRVRKAILKTEERKKEQRRQMALAS